MKRRTLLKAAGAAAAMGLTQRLQAFIDKPATVRWWYHFDDPKASPTGLIAEFEKANPNIRIHAQSIPWGGGSDYDTRLYTALIANHGPDTAMVKLRNLPQLIEMEAVQPIDQYLNGWADKSDISEAIWKLHIAADGKHYYVPLQYITTYLYLRQDWFQKEGLPTPKTFDDFLGAARALSSNDRWGFGLRGDSGGVDFWCTFVIGGGAEFTKGSLSTPAALAANQWYIDLYRKYKVSPPSSPTDGFLQIVNNMKAGRTAMTIHHIGSANQLVQELGDSITAVPVPSGPGGKAWSTYGDGSNAIFANCRNPEAAWQWISYLSSTATNVAFNRLAGQMTVTTSGAKDWNAHPKRFVDATTQSLTSARTLPLMEQTADFVRTVWTQTNQEELLGQTSPDDAMRKFERTFFP
jgi:multiple sugar transport system substrate-binding protein